MVVLILFFFVNSSFFAVQKVVITGLHRLSAETVQDHAEITPGMNYWKLDIGKAEEHLLSHPRIKQVEIERRFPDQVEVEVRERVPVAVLAYQGSYLELDASGLVLAVASDLQGINAPILTGLSPTAFVKKPDLTLTGQRLQQDRLDFLLRLTELLGPSGRNVIGEIHVTTDEDNNDRIVMYSLGGVPVYLGQAQNLKEKVTTFLGLIENSIDNWSSVQYVDIKTPGRAAVKMKGS